MADITGNFRTDGCNTDIGQTFSSMYLAVSYTISPNGSLYNVKFDCTLGSSVRMAWSGDIYATFKIGSITKTETINVSLQGDSSVSSSFSKTFSSLSISGNVKLEVYLDFTPITCAYCYEQNGPGWDGQHSGNTGHFTGIGATSSDITVLSPPSISSLTSTKTANSISFSWSESGTVTSRQYSLDGGSWVTISGPSYTISGLTEGSSHTISVRSGNSAGYSGTLSTTVQTSYTTPVLTITNSPVTLTSLKFNWSSNKDLQSIQYKVGNGSWITNTVSGKSGTIEVMTLQPNTSYTVSFKGTSSSTYGSLVSAEVSASNKTLNIATISSIGDCIFGNAITLSISHPAVSISDANLIISHDSTSPKFKFTISKVPNGQYTFTPTQDQLDSMYKCYTNTNSISLKFQLITTYGDSNGTYSWIDKENGTIKSLTLTGIAKTAHVGDSNEKPRRAQVWVGDSNEKPRRAIVWVGDVNEKPRRCL